MRKIIIVLLLTVVIAFGCAPIQERISIVPSAGVEGIPQKIAVYPLLTTEVVRTARRRAYRFSPITMSTESAEKRIYIVAPAETELKSTMESQLLTGLLSAELTRRGFSLKELPVEAPSEESERRHNSFFVSMETIRYMRENYGLEAILLGNVFFVTDHRDPSDIRVKAVYLRLVDTETLDILCHVSLPDNSTGDYMEETAQALAHSLAIEAGLVTPEPPKTEKIFD